MRKIAFVANGVINNYPLIANLIHTYDRVVAVDGGLFHCREMKIMPDLLVGDLDSTTPELLQEYLHLPILKFPTEKDDTDLELAIKAIDLTNIETIGLFGTMGNRLDHTLNNLNLLYQFSKTIIETENESAFLIENEKQINCFPSQKISLLPLNSSAFGVTTSGLQWELTNVNINQNFRSISNVCLNHSVKINVSKGGLICCLARP